MHEDLRSLIVFQLELEQEKSNFRFLAKKSRFLTTNQEVKIDDFYFCASISLDAAQSIEPHPEADFTNLR